MPIRWTLKNKTRVKDDYIAFDLDDSYSPEIQESSYSVIEVELSELDKELNEDLVVFIGDVEIELFFYSENEESIVLRSYPESFEGDVVKRGNEYERMFFNYFGQAEVSLSSKSNSSTIQRKLIDITMRKDKAAKATEMLEYLSNNVEDILLVCFSKTKGGVVSEKGNQDKFTQFEVLKEVVKVIEKDSFLFIRKHKNTLEKELISSRLSSDFSDRSNQWVMNNLDLAYKSSIDDANIIINRFQTYNIDDIPSETLKIDTNNIENKALHSFFKRALQFLINLKRTFEAEKIAISSMSKGNGVIEFVRFDAVLNKFRIPILEKKVTEISKLLLKINKLSRVFSKYLPAQSSKFVPPKFNSFVLANKHYKIAFHLIAKFYNETQPIRDNNSILMGLRNLSQIYEFTTLFGLINSIKSSGYVLDYSSEHRFSSLSFDGEAVEEKNRDRLNNVYIFSNINSPKNKLKLMYEPQVNCLNEHSIEGDLVRIRKLGNSEYKYYCPDYVVRKYDDDLNKSEVYIFDAKFSTVETVKKFQFEKLTHNYLLGIQEVCSNNQLRHSIKYVGILCGLKNQINHHRLVESVHFVTGKLPVFPQISIEHYNPAKDEHLHEVLSFLFDSE